MALLIAVQDRTVLDSIPSEYVVFISAGPGLFFDLHVQPICNLTLRSVDTCQITSPVLNYTEYGCFREHAVRIAICFLANLSLVCANGLLALSSQHEDAVRICIKSPSLHLLSQYSIEHISREDSQLAEVDSSDPPQSPTTSSRLPSGDGGLSRHIPDEMQTYPPSPLLSDHRVRGDTPHSCSGNPDDPSSNEDLERLAVRSARRSWRDTLASILYGVTIISYLAMILSLNYVDGEATGIPEVNTTWLCVTLAGILAALGCKAGLLLSNSTDPLWISRTVLLPEFYMASTQVIAIFTGAYAAGQQHLEPKTFFAAVPMVVYVVGLYAALNHYGHAPKLQDLFALFKPSG